MPIHVAPVEDRRLFAIGIVLISFLFFALCDTSAKWLAESGIPPVQVSFVRYALHMALIGGLLFPRHGLASFGTSNLKIQLIRAVAMLATTLLNFSAVKFLPLTITGAMMFTTPLLVCALSVPLLGETVGWRRWLAILVGFAGVLIIIQPGSASFSWAILLSVGAVFSSAIYFILTRKLAGKDSPMTMQLYVGIVGTAALLPFAFLDWHWPQDSWTWITFFTVGVFALIGHQISIIAHRFAPASLLAPFTYTQLIWMSITSWLVFDQPPDIWVYIGAPIVIASGFYIWVRERSLSRPQPAPIVRPEQSEEALGSRGG